MLKNTYLFWSGDSELNGQPIVLVISGVLRSYNSKTGAVLQTYILPARTLFTDSLKNGDDTAVCGNCPLKPSKGGICYAFQGVQSISKKVIESSYPLYDDEVDHYLQYRKPVLRMGSYGDPLAVPFEVFKKLIDLCSAQVGYTHQWSTFPDSPYKAYLLASVETLAGKARANSLGWHTYRIQSASDVEADEVVCANQVNKYVTCEACKKCDGHANVTSTVHGLDFKKRNFQKLFV